jgi:FdhD protein
VDGEPLAVLMRTPGRDEDLAAGFLLTEGVIDGPDDIGAMAPCRDQNRVRADNVLLVRLAPGCDRTRLKHAKRTFLASTSCGVCGKASIESVHQKVVPHAGFLTVAAERIDRMSDAVRCQQAAFDQTGGLHAAAVFEHDGSLAFLAEDIGRHNAVDKVLGRALRDDRIPLENSVLWVSGRSSFEVVQKALMAGVGAIVAVGAPTSLAVDLAEQSCLTLIGFASRPGRFNVYSGRVADVGSQV